MKKLLFLFVSLGLFLQVQGQQTEIYSELQAADPESVGMSVERLGRIDKKLQKMVDDGIVPGAVALIARDGKIVMHKAYGVSNTATGEAMEQDDIFRIASQTKAITATAVMMLWEEGLFHLDEPISNYIPEFKDTQVLVGFNEADTTYTTRPASKPITIRHLITHTSGIGYGMIDSDPRFQKIYHKAGIIDAFTTKNISIEENIKKLAKLPLHHDPGEKMTYSEGLDVLGYFVEIISGQPFDEYLREHLFNPLGMKDTWFYLPEGKAERLVKVHHKPEAKWEPMIADSFDPDFPINGAKTFFSGGAGLSSTAMDYARFLQMYLNKGTFNRSRILSPTTVRTIMHNQVDTLAGKTRGYGLAFGLINEAGEAAGGQGSEGTFDWAGYFNTSYFADPETGVIGILMKQTVGQEKDFSGYWFRLMVMAAVDSEAVRR